MSLGLASYKHLCCVHLIVFRAGCLGQENRPLKGNFKIEIEVIIKEFYYAMVRHLSFGHKG
jgi:hypothetical protein